jgi:hypothetical protein
VAVDEDLMVYHVSLGDLNKLVLFWFVFYASTFFVPCHSAMTVVGPVIRMS